MFAKIYETDLGQILVKKGDTGGLPEVRYFFDMEHFGFGICEMAAKQKYDNDECWAATDELFDKATLDAVIEMRSKIINELTTSNA